VVERGDLVARHCRPCTESVKDLKAGGKNSSGRQVSVIYAKTGEDVTAFILSQIIVEEAKNHNILLPVPFLHLVIRHGEKVLREFFEKYLELTIKNHLFYKAAFDEQFERWLDVGKNFSTIAQKTIPAATPWESLLDLFLSPGKRDEEKDSQP
jgi:polyhydroxyalkanoate synthesis regulator protein